MFSKIKDHTICSDNTKDISGIQTYSTLYIYKNCSNKFTYSTLYIYKNCSNKFAIKKLHRNNTNIINLMRQPTIIKGAIAQGTMLQDKLLKKMN